MGGQPGAAETSDRFGPVARWGFAGRDRELDTVLERLRS